MAEATTTEQPTPQQENHQPPKSDPAQNQQSGERQEAATDDQLKSALSALQQGADPESVARGNTDTAQEQPSEDSTTGSASSQSAGQATESPQQPETDAGQSDDGQGQQALPESARTLLESYNKYKGQLDNMDASEALSTARERAKESLKRFKWTDEQINTLPDEVLLERGSEARQQQVSIDSNENQKQQLIKQLEELGVQVPESAKAGEAEGGDETGQQPNPQQNAEGDAGGSEQPNPQQQQDGDLSTLVANAFSDVEDDSDMPTYGDVKQRLVSVLSQYEQARGNTTSEPDQSLKQELKQVNERVEQLTSQRDDLYQQLDDLYFQNTVQQMQADYPDLQDRSVRDQVMQQAQQLADLPSYRDSQGRADWQKLIKDAYRIQYADQLQQRAQREMTQRYQSEVQGQPEGESAGESAGVGSHTQGAEDNMQEALRMLQNGEDPEKVNRLMQRRAG